MPYHIVTEDGKYQVKNSDTGDNIGKPHDTRKEASDHLKALYSNVTDATMQYTNTMNAAVKFEADQINPRLLHFHDFILARAEINKNKDAVDERGIKELAETIPGMPIDYNHDGKKNVGFFSAGRVGSDNELRVDGAIWLDRCEENGVEPQEVLDGLYGMSIEADATTAECSVCHQIYSNADKYCEHLQVEGDDFGLRSRLKHNATRIMRGLRALGGAFTKNPAGSGTGMDSMSGIRFAASHINVEATMANELNASEIVELWINNIVASAIEAGEISKREDVSDADKKRAEKEYGDVEYADEKNKKYPLDKEHIHSAWSYINMPKNAAKYSSEELAAIKGKIQRAAKKLGMEISEDEKKNKENASTMDDEKNKNEKSSGEDGDEDEMKANYEAAKKQVEELGKKLEAENKQKAEMEGKLQAAEEQLTEVKQKLEAAQLVIKEHRVNELRASFVGSVMDEAEFTAKQDMLYALPQDAIELMTRTNKPKGERQQMMAAVEPTEATEPRLF
jgi:hypothetical protein